MLEAEGFRTVDTVMFQGKRSRVILSASFNHFFRWCWIISFLFLVVVSVSSHLVS